ncbi:MAG TPA: hypothetical protein V6D29_19425 [Leptolyngbyaceae cyanobacterium]
MASSSRPFQSQTINRLLGTYYAWSQKLSQGIRWLRIGAVWALQVALYPGYAAFQASRVIYRKIAAADPVGQLVNLRKSQPLPIKTWLSPNQSDGSIRLLLGWLMQPNSPVFEGYLPQVALPGLALAVRQSDHLATSHSAGVSRRPNFQGVATDLETQALVLVAEGNQLLNALSPEEQGILARVISWLLAEQEHDRWRQKQQMLAGKLPLLSPNRRSWWPIQLFQHLMRWMSMTPVAKMTNLFGEVQLAEELRTRRLLNHEAKLQLLPTEATTTNILLPQPDIPSTPPRQFPFNWAPALPLTRAQKPTNAVKLTAGQSTAAIQVTAGQPTATVANRELATSSQTVDVASLTPPNSAADDLPWIEAKAVVVSYVDHPLVTLLWWVDRGLTWLESLLQRTWDWVRSRVTF